MVLFNYSTRELTAKIVYYGPGLCGKTTNLQYIHENLPGEVRGKMLSLATKTDRTLFFDFLPIDLGEIRGMKTRVQLYTVPGQVFYNETRKLVLKGADGIVFVADSQETMLGANVESFKNLEENLKAHGMKLAEMPHVIQFNKRDLPKLTGIEDLNAALNKFNAPFYESVATSGIGVQDTLKAIVKLVLLQLTKKYDPKSVPAVAERPASVAAPVQTRAPQVAVAAVAATAAPPSRASAHVASTAVAAPSAGLDEERPSVPLSPAAEEPAPRRASTPPPPSLRRAAPSTLETMPPFADEEIDGLVDEVEELQIPDLPLSAPEPEPAAAAPAPPPSDPEEGVWLGAPEGEDASAFADPSATFGANVSIEDLLSQDAAAARPEEPPAPEPAWRQAAAFDASFEVDRGFDPEWKTPAVPAPAPAAVAPPQPPVRPLPEPPPAALAADDRPIAPFPLPTADDTEVPESDVVLTEVASDHDLFNDPSLEVARLGDGEAREIIVPVMLGAGATARRFKLAIRLRFDPVE